MLIFFLSITILLASFISTYGWGRIVARLTYGNSNQHWAFLTALGLACLIFLGGITNAINIAYSGILFAIFFAGIIFSVVPLFKYFLANPLHLFDIRSNTSFDKGCFILSIFIIITTSVFLIASLLPTDAFNIHDDFQTYLVRPFQMLQTGTISGNPFDVLSIDSLGGQSFLQAFIIAIFPISYVNGVDIVFCFVLVAFLLVGIARLTKAHALYLILAIAALILINPQVVNISALYSGSSMILGIIFASIMLADSYTTKGTASAFVEVVPFALFISALISLKMTLAVFAILYFIIYFLALLIFSKDKKHIALTGAFLTVLVLFFLLPWISVYRENYWYIIQSMLHESPKDIFGNSHNSLQGHMIKDYFSSNRLLYGGSFLGYALVMLIILVASILSAYLAIKKKHAMLRPYLIAVFVAGTVGITSYFVNAHFWDPETALRYSCPIFIAVLPFAVLILGSQFGVFSPIKTGNKQKTASGQSVMLSVLVLIHIILLGLFGNTLLERFNLAYHTRTTLEIPFDSQYIQFNKIALTNDVREIMRSIQNKTEEGQTILAWISIPFHLDFDRNKILTVTEPGLLNPWIDIPLTGKPEDIRRYLRSRGIRYVIWEYAGYGMKHAKEYRSYLTSPYVMFRKIGQYNLYFSDMLFALAGKGFVIYDTDGIAILDLG